MLEYQRRLAPTRAASPGPVSEQSRLVERDFRAGLRPGQVPADPRAGDSEEQGHRRSPGQGALPPSRIPARPGAKLAVGAVRDRWEQEADQVADTVVRRLGGRVAGSRADEDVREAMEESFGADLSGVRVHEDAAAHDLSEQLNATAFTMGRDVFLSRGASGPAQPERHRLMAHELTHVIQQGAVPARAGQRTTASPLIQRLTPPADARRARERFAETRAAHRAQSRVLKNWFEQARSSSDVLLKSSYEWIASGLSKLYAVTRTGDSYERVSHQGKDPTQVTAYFPKAEDAAEGGDINDPDGGNYDHTDLDDNDHVMFEGAATKGWNSTKNSPTTIAITRLPTSTGPLRFLTNQTRDPVSKQEVFATLKHEVQHAADRHQDKLDELGARGERSGRLLVSLRRLADAVRGRGTLRRRDIRILPADKQGAARRVRDALRGGGKPVRKDVRDVRDATLAEVSKVEAQTREDDSLLRLERYKTEYRAYSYSGLFDKYDNVQNYDAFVPANFTVPPGHWTRRQFQIFQQIYLNYPGIKKGWDDNVLLPKGSFRQQVVAYLDPDVEGVNKLNSPRINAVYDALLKVPRGTVNVDSGDALDILLAVDKLTPLEAAYIRNKEKAEREITAELRLRIQDPNWLRSILEVLENKMKHLDQQDEAP